MACRESPPNNTVLPTGGICPYKEYCRVALLQHTPERDGDHKGPAVVCRASLLSYAFDRMFWGEQDAAVCWASLRRDPDSSESG